MYGSFEITSIRLYTLLHNPLRDEYNLIEVISSWTEQKLRSILKYTVIVSKFFSSKGKSQFITLYLFVISDRMVRPELPPRSISLGSADIPVCAFLNYVLSLGLLVLWNRKYILTLLYIFYSHFILYLYFICFGSFYLTFTISHYRDRLIYKYENTII